MKKIEFSYNNIKRKGFIISENNEEYTIKLKNGYNIIVPKNEIEILETKKVEINKKKINNQTNKNKNKNLPKVLILHTGGTIASKVDYSTGAVSSKFTPEEILKLIPEIKELANVESELVENIASDDIRFKHYNIFLKEIENNYKNFDGIIITHGTDTMHYTSSALYYSLENLNIPVLLVGAQRSSDRPSSDAFLNLISAVKFINYNSKSNFKFNNVGVCMHYDLNDEDCVILHGVNVRKLHSSRRDAFKPINKREVALINYYKDKVKIVDESYFSNFENVKNLKSNENKLKVTYYNENLKIGILKVHPNMWAEEINFYKNFDGLIIEGTGLGHLPITNDSKITQEHDKICKNLKELSKKIPIVITTQTVYGRVNLNVYSPGRRLKKLGIKGNYSDLSAESSFIKLAYELSKK